MVQNSDYYYIITKNQSCESFQRQVFTYQTIIKSNYTVIMFSKLKFIANEIYFNPLFDKCTNN